MWNEVRGDGLRDILLPRLRMGDGAELRDFGEPVGHPFAPDDTRRLNFRDLFDACCVVIWPR